MENKKLCAEDRASLITLWRAQVLYKSHFVTLYAHPGERRLFNVLCRELHWPHLEMMQIQQFPIICHTHGEGQQTVARDNDMCLRPLSPQICCNGHISHVIQDKFQSLKTKYLDLPIHQAGQGHIGHHSNLDKCRDQFFEWLRHSQHKSRLFPDGQRTSVPVQDFLRNSYICALGTWTRLHIIPSLTAKSTASTDG